MIAVYNIRAWPTALTLYVAHHIPSPTQIRHRFRVTRDGEIGRHCIVLRLPSNKVDLYDLYTLFDVLEASNATNHKNGSLIVCFETLVVEVLLLGRSWSRLLPPYYRRTAFARPHEYPICRYSGVG